jgi:TRAP-type C4-dicarboxylate transport system substrate-binding protein
LRREGVTVSTVDGAAFRAAMTPVWAEFAKRFGADNIRRIQEFR